MELTSRPKLYISKGNLYKMLKVLHWTLQLFRLALLVGCCIAAALGQSATEVPTIVQPGAPGQASKILPPSTRATLPPHSRKDVEFMQGMIHHHAQAVEMTALIEARTENKNIRLLGARISQSQADEMNFMRRWLGVRGEPVELVMAKADAPNTADSHSHSGHSGPSAEHKMLMPGMLSAKQMDALKKAKGGEFEKLFLTGMIQHHEGALVMVKDLFDTAGAGQDAELFNFATDVDTGQRAEIGIMRNILGERSVK